MRINLRINRIVKFLFGSYENWAYIHFHLVYKYFFLLLPAYWLPDLSINFVGDYQDPVDTPAREDVYASFESLDIKQTKEN